MDYAFIEALNSAVTLAERVLLHARVTAGHSDRLSQRDLVAHAAAIVALLTYALETIEPKESQSLCEIIEKKLENEAHPKAHPSGTPHP
jgi:hypothetical protein